MSDTATTDSIDRLRHSVAQVQQIRSSAIITIGMMALGVAILVGGIAYTAAKITPLEDRARTLRREIAHMEGDALTRRVELARSTDALAVARRQLDSTNTTLRQLASTGTLTPAAQSQVTSALRSGERAEVTVAAAAEQNSSTGALSQREDLDVLLARLFDPSSVVRLKAYDDLMAQHGSSPELVPALLRYADAHTDNLNGIYNALVVLNTVSRRQLGAHQAEVSAFLGRVEGLGPRIAARTEDVRRRLRGRGGATADAPERRLPVSP